MEQLRHPKYSSSQEKIPIQRNTPKYQENDIATIKTNKCNIQIIENLFLEHPNKYTETFEDKDCN
jgi:hypothetical protein